MPTSNWDDVFEAAGNVDDTPPPASTYLCTVETAEWVKTAKGKDMLKYRLRIGAGTQKQKALFGNIVISPENPMALQIGLRHLEALGLTREVLKSMTDSEQQDFVVGREVQVDTGLKTYKGTERSEVKDIKAAAGSAPAPASANTPPPSSNTPPPAPFGES